MIKLEQNSLDKYYPKTKGKITSYEVGTPLSNQFYLNAPNGEGYGLEASAHRFSEGHLLKPKTYVEGLYLTGQDVCTLGFTGALMGGVLTAHSILGYGTLLDLITNFSFLAIKSFLYIISTSLILIIVLLH